MDHTKPYPSSYHQSQLATMNAHFSTQTDFYQGIPIMQPFKFESRGAGIANLTAKTTPLLPSPKSTTPMAAPGQNRALRPHVAAIAKKNKNK